MKPPARPIHTVIRRVCLLAVVFLVCPDASGQVQASVSASLDVPCLVRIVGASQSEVLVNASAVNTALVPGETYALKLRFGRAGAFSYAVTNPFKMPAVGTNEAARLEVGKDHIRLVVKEAGSEVRSSMTKNRDGSFTFEISDVHRKTSTDRILALTASSADAFGVERIWLDVTGKQLRASFMQRSDTAVTLWGTNKQVFTVPLERFGESDRAYLSKLPPMPAASP
jgi:hypothetical protein